MTQDFENFKKNCWIFSYNCLLLKSYHIIQILIAHIGLKTRSVDQSFQKAYGLNGFDILFSHPSTEFLVFACFRCCLRSHKTHCDVLLITYA